MLFSEQTLKSVLSSGVPTSVQETSKGVINSTSFVPTSTNIHVLLLEATTTLNFTKAHCQTHQQAKRHRDLNGRDASCPSRVHHCHRKRRLYPWEGLVSASRLPDIMMSADIYSVISRDGIFWCRNIVLESCIWCCFWRNVKRTTFFKSLRSSFQSVRGAVSLLRLRRRIVASLTGSYLSLKTLSKLTSVTKDGEKMWRDTDWTPRPKTDSTLLYSCMTLTASSSYESKAKRRDSDLWASWSFVQKFLITSEYYIDSDQPKTTIFQNR